MTPLLRKTHRFAWMVIAICLPFAWWASVNAITDQPVGTIVQFEEDKALPILKNSVETDGFLFNLRTDSTGEKRQLEVLVKKPLASPNVVVTVRSNEQENFAIGVLNQRGIKRFNLSTPRLKDLPPVFILEDRIKGVALRSVTL